MDSQLILQIVILIILLIGSAFFSSAETAFTTVNRIKVQLMADDEDDPKAKKVLWILDNSTRMLSAILIGNNIVNIFASSLMTVLTIRVVGNTYVGIATGILTLVILIVGEIMPKSLAAAYSLKIALAYAGLIKFFMIILTPVILIIEGIRVGLLRMFGIDPDEKQDVMTEDELKSLVDVSFEEGAIEDDEFEMISNVFRLDESLAKDIMIPRIDMVFVQVDSTYDELMDIFRENQYTRYPVYAESTNTVIGTINVKDLLTYPRDKEFDIRDILRAPDFTFEHKEVGTLLIEMRESSISVVIVLDEYGATSGMITFEDILEEIVGEIRDEYDKDETDSIRELARENEFLIEGSTNIDDVNEELDIELESEEYESIGGLIIEKLDRLPKNGEAIILDDGIKIIAEIVKRNRIEKVRIILPKEENEE